MGKSRIIACCIVILNLLQTNMKQGERQYDVIFTTEYLMNRDSKEYQSWIKGENLQGSVHFACDMSNLKGHFVLLDEAD